MAYKYVEVEVDLDEFSDADLIEEIKARNITGTGVAVDLEEQVTSIWMLRRLGKDYQKELEDLIYNVIGKIV